jgi:hypothetical protein
MNQMATAIPIHSANNSANGGNIKARSCSMAQLNLQSAQQFDISLWSASQALPLIVTQCVRSDACEAAFSWLFAERSKTLLYRTT